MPLLPIGKNLQNYVNELIEAVDFFGTPASSGS